MTCSRRGLTTTRSTSSCRCTSHWQFSTGPVGDIETLARRLRTPAQYAGDKALLQQLRHIGEQQVAVDADHLLFDGVTPGETTFEGAMVSLDFNPAAPDAGYATKLQEMLNSGHDASVDGTAPADHVPTLSPPIYGEHPAKRHTVNAANVSNHWLDGLGCQPRYRLAAGWGAEVVRQNQDEFMQAAWEQVGDVLSAERAFSLARLSRDVLKRVEARHLSKLPPERLLAVMAPARARIRVSPTESLYGQIAGATLPHELFDGSMRRLTSARRATFRMAHWRERELAAPSTATQMTALVETFADASQHLDAVDPNRFVPDGLMGSRLVRCGSAARRSRDRRRSEALHRPRSEDDRRRDQSDPGAERTGPSAGGDDQEERAAHGRRVAPGAAHGNARDSRRAARARRRGSRSRATSHT